MKLDKRKTLAKSISHSWGVELETIDEQEHGHLVKKNPYFHFEDEVKGLEIMVIYVGAVEKWIMDSPMHWGSAEIYHVVSFKNGGSYKHGAYASLEDAHKAWEQLLPKITESFEDEEGRVVQVGNAVLRRKEEAELAALDELTSEMLAEEMKDTPLSGMTGDAW